MYIKYHVKCENCKIDKEVFEGGRRLSAKHLAFCEKCKKIESMSVFPKMLCTCGFEFKLFTLPNKGKQAIVFCPICKKESLHYNILEWSET